MAYTREFETFNPLSGSISDTFTYLPAIAPRARALLTGRTLEEVKYAAEGIDWCIDEWFSDAVQSKQQEISQLKAREIERILTTMAEPRRWKDEDTSDYEDAEKFCYFQRDDHGSGEWIFDTSKEVLLERSIEESLGIPNSDDTDELTALKHCLDTWNDDEIAGPDFPEGKAFELFAVLALWKLAEAMEALEDSPARYSGSMREFLIAQDKFLEALTGNRDFKIRGQMSRAATCAIQAMEAVCYAEHLFTLKQFEDKQVQNLTNQKEQERTRRLESAIRLNISRHEKTNAAKAKVLHEWEKEPDQFPSAEKAGRFYADWLLEQDAIFEPRTVTGWIRSHARSIGIRFR